MRNADLEAARSYHEATCHTEQRLLESHDSLDWDNKPLPFKIYRELEPIPLVQDFGRLEMSALRAIRGEVDPTRSNALGDRVPNLAELSRVLYLTAGITKRVRYPGGEVYFRAHPNTGALYHIDLYLVCGGLPDLPAGVYHFGPHDFALRRLREGDHRATLVEATSAEPSVAHAPVVIVSASTYWRNAWKYKARAYRHCFWDAGTLHANLLAAATADALPVRIVMGFVDRSVEHLLGLDPVREGALTLVPLGHSADTAPPAPESPDLHLETQPLSQSQVDYPQIHAMHAASSLESSTEALRWRAGSPVRRVPPVPGALIRLGPDSAEDWPAGSLESVIRRRGSTRVFDRSASLRLAELTRVLAGATEGVLADFIDPPGSTLIDVYLIIHRVEGLRPGTYYYRREERALELMREGDFRRIGGRLGLFQELSRDACVNVYCLAQLGSCLDRFGNRGYRAAQLEGGILGGRAYLGAYSQGFGATGLTFLDHEVTEFFSPHAEGKAVMFLVALGRSVQKQRPGELGAV
jgi:SagB-type dehydrogenase family enzyme